MRVSLAPLFVLLTLLVFPSTHAQEQAGLDALASDTSSAILKSSDIPAKAKRVLVVDFARMYEAPNQLGVELAQEFSDSLTRQTNGLIVIDRSELLREVAQDRLLEGDDRRPDVRNCYAGELGADAVVEGFLKDVPKGTTLWIKAWRVGDHKVIFEKGITLTLAPEMKALAAKPVVHPPVVPLSGKNMWVKPPHPPVANVAATPVPKCCDKGYTPRHAFTVPTRTSLLLPPQERYKAQYFSMSKSIRMASRQRFQFFKVFPAA